MKGIRRILLVVTIFANVILYLVLTLGAHKRAEAIMLDAIGCMKEKLSKSEEIQDNIALEAQLALIEKAYRLRHLLAKEPLLLDNQALLEDFCREQGLDEVYITDESGSIIASVPENIPADMSFVTDETARYYVNLTDNPELVIAGYSEEDEYGEAASAKREAAGVARTDSDGIIVVAKAVREYEYFMKALDARHISDDCSMGHNGFFIICRDGTVVSSGMPGLLGNSAGAYSFLSEKDKPYWSTINGRSFYTLYGSCDGYGIFAYMSKLEVYGNRNVVMLAALSASLLIIIILIISRQKSLNEAVKDANNAMDEANIANKAKTEFLSNISHDIRTPLSGIMGMTELARQKSYDRAYVNRCLDKIEGSSRHLLSLVNDVLDMNRIESGKSEAAHNEVDLRHIIDECMDIIHGNLEHRDIELSVVRREIKTPYVFGDELQIRLIVINILSNAVKFTPDKGRIEFVAENSRLDDNHILVTYTIKDTGIGMSEEFLNRLFAPFVQEKSRGGQAYEGTGLGMAITKRCVEIMNGDIQVKSELNKGTCFVVRLPFEINHAHVEAADTDSHSQENLEGIKVLLAEDNELNLEIAATLLEECNAVVTTVNNGRGLVEIFEASPENSFDVIVTDIKMPEMTGYEAAGAIRAMNRSDAARIPIIAMSADIFEETDAKMRKAGIDEYIIKPIAVKELVRVIRKYTDVV